MLTLLSRTRTISLSCVLSLPKVTQLLALCGYILQLLFSCGDVGNWSKQESHTYERSSFHRVLTCVRAASKVLERSHAYFRPPPVASVRPSSASVSICALSSPYVVPPTQLTEMTWLTPQRSRSALFGTFCSHYGLGYSAVLLARVTDSSHAFHSATAVDANAAARPVPSSVS